MILKTALPALIVLTTLLNVSADYYLYFRGYVMDYSANPIPGAIASIAGHGDADTTDDSGWFYINCVVADVDISPSVTGKERLTISRTGENRNTYVLDLQVRMVQQLSEQENSALLSNCGRGIFFLQRNIDGACRTTSVLHLAGKAMKLSNDPIPRRQTTGTLAAKTTAASDIWDTLIIEHPDYQPWRCPITMHSISRSRIFLAATNEPVPERYCLSKEGENFPYGSTVHKAAESIWCNAFDSLLLWEYDALRWSPTGVRRDNHPVWTAHPMPPWIRFNKPLHIIIGEQGMAFAVRRVSGNPQGCTGYGS